MGTTERMAKKKRRKARVQRIVLGTIAAAGVIAIAAVAPNAMQILSLFDGGKTRKKRPRYVVETAFTRLLDKGCIRLEKTPRGKFVRLTPEGKLALARMVARSRDDRKHKRWDKRWRIVTYDIKVARNTTRLQLRQTLKNFGFYKLQNSVWIYPYDCEELITLLKADFKIGRDVLYMVVEHIENDHALREYFNVG